MHDVIVHALEVEPTPPQAGNGVIKGLAAHRGVPGEGPVVLEHVFQQPAVLLVADAV